jgi:hypothetical protein
MKNRNEEMGMNNHIIAFGLVFILILVTLTGCQENTSPDNTLTENIFFAGVEFNNWSLKPSSYIRPAYPSDYHESPGYFIMEEKCFLYPCILFSVRVTHQNGAYFKMIN